MIFPLALVNMSDTKVNATTDGPDYNHDKVLTRGLSPIYVPKLAIFNPRESNIYQKLKLTPGG